MLPVQLVKLNEGTWKALLCLLPMTGSLTCLYVNDSAFAALGKVSLIKAEVSISVEYLLGSS